MWPVRGGLATARMIPVASKERSVPLCVCVRVCVNNYVTQPRCHDVMMYTAALLRLSLVRLHIHAVVFVTFRPMTQQTFTDANIGMVLLRGNGVGPLQLQLYACQLQYK